ncbi:hypothetical protein ACZ91_02465 [Streptomyces regensis]|uniref:YGGT family protein n=1 Tax=Prauserella rugosa TaxID=43354 RepID=A0A660CCG0_9PSEU|nr:hypothetical protein ACZ91_02465 [Streptomyces regensis]TWH21248.1 hypothetical protein JD82_03104 [Prauserella rugosa]
MGEHTEKNAQGSAGGGVGSEAAQVPQPSVPTETNEATQQPRENTTGQGSRRAEKKSPSVDWSAIRERAVGLLAGIVRWAGLIFALILVGHIIFVIGEANPDNSIVSWAADWSEGLALGFHDLFQPTDPKLSVLINYGIAAIFWLVVSSIVAKVIRRVGGGSV